MLYQTADLMSRALQLVLVLSAPPIIAAAVAGLVVGVFQSATQLHDQTLPYAAKFAVIAMVIFAMAGVTGATLYDFGNRIFEELPLLIRQ